MTPLESLVNCGTKLWLDSVDPGLVQSNKQYGATGATSNPIIIADLIKSGRFDDDLSELMEQNSSDDEVAWAMTDKLVRMAQAEFAEINDQTAGNDGYVSFELDPLLEDVDNPQSIEERAARYIALGKAWSDGHSNRMIKVPATPAGLASLEELAAHGVPLNVTLIFTERQYEIARHAIWSGAQRRNSLDRFKSVYSIFVSRVDVYTKKHVPELSDAAQGLVGIVNAQLLWKNNDDFWSDKNAPLKQEIVFASTGTKDPADPADKYVAALAGSDIQTNPPATNDAIQQLSDRTYTRAVDQLPADGILSEIRDKVDVQTLEDVLMDEGLKKFADPQKALLALIAEKRSALIAESA